jgi:hypothetical protein
MSEENKPFQLSDNSNISIPLRNLISMIAVTALSVWLYFGLTERLSMLEHNFALLEVEVEENDTWIDEWSPPKAVQDTISRVQELEKITIILDNEIKYLKERINK